MCRVSVCFIFLLINSVSGIRILSHIGTCKAVTDQGLIDLSPLARTDGKPRYADQDKCIECGLCYTICPEIDELDEETKQKIEWSSPIGRVIETVIARATDSTIRDRATDGAAWRPAVKPAVKAADRSGEPRQAWRILGRGAGQGDRLCVWRGGQSCAARRLCGWQPS